MEHMSQKRNSLEYEIVLALLKKDSHGRALAKELCIPHATLSRKLTELVKENVLDFEQQGKNKVYALKRNIRARSHIYKAEQYKLLLLIKTYPRLEPIISDILKAKEELIIIFGSFSKFTVKKDSDIDIYIETTNKKTKDEIESIYAKVNIKVGTFDLSSNLIKEIIKNHIIIKGVEKFYDRTRFFD